MVEETMNCPCNRCIYYHPENNTCQSKKCATGGAGYVTRVDRKYCETMTEIEELLYKIQVEDFYE